jgi:plastocyanin
MMKRLGLLSCLCLALISCGGGAPPPATTAPPSDAPRSTTPPPTGNAAVEGVVTFEGTPPKGAPIDMTSDPACCPPGVEPVFPESLVVGSDRGLANVLVRVSRGLAPTSWPIPSEPVVLDQKGCRYAPHVLGILAGQKLRVLNPDKTFHNVRTTSKVNKAVNLPMMADITELTQVFETPGESFSVRCDVHPWMEGWIHVLENPYFTVTDRDGRFALAGLPAGDYTIEAWHERLGVQTATAHVADGETSPVNFSFRAP